MSCIVIPKLVQTDEFSIQSYTMRFCWRIGSFFLQEYIHESWMQYLIPTRVTQVLVFYLMHLFFHPESWWYMEICSISLLLQNKLGRVIVVLLWWDVKNDSIYKIPKEFKKFMSTLMTQTILHYYVLYLLLQHPPLQHNKLGPNHHSERQITWCIVV